MSKSNKKESKKSNFWHTLDKNKYLISVILIIVLSLIGYFVNIEKFEFIEWLKNTENLFTPWCNLKFFALLIAGYELFLIITNGRKKLAFSGSMILAFSSCVAYNFNKIDSLIFGSIVLVLFNKLLNSDNKKQNILYTCLIVVLSIMYSYSFIPFAIVFGYIFIALLVFVLIKNKEKLKEKKVYVISCILLGIIGIICSKFIYPNNYTEDSIGNIQGTSLMFYYVFNCFIPFKQLNYKEFLGSIYAITPLPVFIALYYVYKNEKHVNFLLPVSIATVFEIIFCLSGFPNIINKTLFLENISNTRMMIGVHLANLFLLYYFIGNIDEKIFSTKVNMRISIFLAVILVIIGYPTVFSNRLYLTFFASEIVGLSFLFLNLEESKYKKVLIFMLVVLTLVSGVPVYLAM